MKVEESPSKETPLPKQKLFVIFIMLLCDMYALTSLVPYLGYMVLDFGLTDDKSQVGFYAGIIASCYFVAQFFSSFFWGFMSDRFGRRPVLLCGIFGSCLTCGMFAFSTNFIYCVATRSLFGLLNGNIGVYKTYLSEITDDTNRPKGFTIIGLTFGVGIITGPLIGGFLARPMVLYQDIVWLRPILKRGSIFERFPYMLPNLVLSIFCFFGLIIGYFNLTETKNLKVTKESIPVLQKIKNFFKSEIIRSFPPLTTCFMYAMLGMASTGFDEVFPLWALIPPPAGMGFSTIEIGIITGCSGVYIIIIQLFIYKPLVAKIGVLWAFRIGSVFSLAIIPIVDIAYLSDTRWAAWLLLLTALGCRIIWTQLTFTSVFVMINNSVTSESMGTLNGIAQSLVALNRAFAPFALGSLFAWSIENGLPFPIDKHFVFILCATAQGLGFFLSFFLPKSINVSKKSPIIGKETQLLDTPSH